VPRSDSASGRRTAATLSLVLASGRLQFPRYPFTGRLLSVRLAGPLFVPSHPRLSLPAPLWRLRVGSLADLGIRRSRRHATFWAVLCLGAVPPSAPVYRTRERPRRSRGAPFACADAYHPSGIGPGLISGWLFGLPCPGRSGHRHLSPVLPHDPADGGLLDVRLGVAQRSTLATFFLASVFLRVGGSLFLIGASAPSSYPLSARVVRGRGGARAGGVGCEVGLPRFLACGRMPPHPALPPQAVERGICGG